MSIYRPLHLGLHILQNVQAYQTNQKLGQILDHLKTPSKGQVSRVAAPTDSAASEFLSDFRPLFDQSLSASQRAYVAMLFLDLADYGQIGLASFSTFSERDAFSKMAASAKVWRVLGREELGDDFPVMEALAMAPRILQHVEAAIVWKRAESMMPGGRLIWNGLPGWFWWGMQATVYTGAVSLLMPHSIFMDFGFLIAIGAAACATGGVILRSARARTIEALVSPHDGVFGPRATKAQVESLQVESLRHSFHPWFQPNDRSLEGLVRARNSLLERIQEVGTQFAVRPPVNAQNQTPFTR